jgi:hypothetical protein
MWNTIKNFFWNLFHTPPQINKRLKNYDDELYSETIQTPKTYMIDHDLILDRRTVRQKFLDIIKYYNDVIMTNTVILSEKEILDCQKKLFRIDQERNKYRLHDEYKSRIDIPEDFLSYVLKKVESIQESLGTFNKQLGFFYNRNRFTYDSISITIIVLSSSLSLIEGITLIFSEENTVSTILSLLIGTTIAILTSILKFKNIKEKIEELVKMREKIHNCQAKLYTFDKELKTSIFLSSNTSSNGQDDFGGDGSFV